MCCVVQLLSGVLYFIFFCSRSVLSNVLQRIEKRNGMVWETCVNCCHFLPVVTILQEVVARRERLARRVASWLVCMTSESAPCVCCPFPVCSHVTLTCGVRKEKKGRNRANAERHKKMYFGLLELGVRNQKKKSKGSAASLFFISFFPFSTPHIIHSLNTSSTFRTFLESITKGLKRHPAQT